jgi:amidophosphoribosyltransferase
MPTKDELIAGNMNEDEIEKFLKVDALLYQKIDDLVEAVTRKGNHHIDTPCMACLDGKYVANDIDDAKISEMESMRNHDRNGN